MGKTYHVFVYGTLKHGCGGVGKLVGKAVTVNPFVMFDGGFPMVVPPERQDDVKPSLIGGEVYEVDEDGMKHLDRYEGFPSHYGRIETPVQIEGGIELQPWMYIGSEQAQKHRTERFVIPDEHGILNWGN